MSYLVIEQSVHCHELVPTMAFVLSGFSDSPLRSSQWCTVWAECSKWYMIPSNGEAVKRCWMPSAAYRRQSVNVNCRLIGSVAAGPFDDLHQLHCARHSAFSVKQSLLSDDAGNWLKLAEVWWLFHVANEPSQENPFDYFWSGFQNWDWPVTQGKFRAVHNEVHEQHSTAYFPLGYVIFHCASRLLPSFKLVSHPLVFNGTLGQPVSYFMSGQVSSACAKWEMLV